MSRLLAILAILLSLSLTAGTVAHAMEPIGCVSAEDASQLGHFDGGHFDGDRDEVPSDDGKGMPHHHGGCHGHHVAEPARDSAIGLPVAIRALPAFGSVGDGVSALTDPAYRPPRA